MSRRGLFFYPLYGILAADRKPRGESALEKRLYAQRMSLAENVLGGCPVHCVTTMHKQKSISVSCRACDAVDESCLAFRANKIRQENNVKGYW